MSSPLLLDPHHRAVLDGDRQALLVSDRFCGGGCLLLCWLPVAVLSGCATLWLAGDHESLRHIATWDAILLLVGLRVLQGQWRIRRLMRRGQLVEGVVTSARSRLDGDDDLWVTLHYTFQNPAGKTVSGRLTRSLKRYKDEELPAPGTPLAVLYADRFTHEVL